MSKSSILECESLTFIVEDCTRIINRKEIVLYARFEPNSLDWSSLSVTRGQSELIYEEPISDHTR